MKNLLTKWLAALLAAMLLLSPVALMEELEPAAVEPAEAVEETAPAEEAAPAEEEAEEAVEEEIAIADVDEAVEEEEESSELIVDEEVIYEEPEAELVVDDAMDWKVDGDTEPESDSAEYGIAINATNFPDPNFRRFVWTYDSDAVGTEGRGYLSPSELTNVMYMNISNWDGDGGSDSQLNVSAITDLTGIENFTNLRELRTTETNITTLDLTPFPILASVVQSYYPFTYNYGYDNYIQIEYSNHEYGNNNYAGVSFKNGVTVTPTPKADENVVPIDAAHFPDPALLAYLQTHYPNSNRDGWISKGEIELCTSLTLGEWDENDNRINLGITSLQGLEVFTNLTELYCNYNKLTSLDLSKFPKLEWLYCEKNSLTAIDISDCPGLLKFVNPAAPVPLESDATIVRYGPETYNDSEGSGTGYHLWCDAGVTIITQKPAPAPVSAPIPTITATKKNQKCTIKAAPGSVYQLDLGGKTAKSIKSSKKKVATVSSTGLVTVKKAGKTTITIKISKKKTRKVKLTIKDPTIPTSVTLPVASKAVKKGDVITLTPVIPAGTNSTFKWKSSNKRVATVNNGVVTFKKKGKVTITCTAVRGKKKRKVTFKVSPQ